MYSKKGSNLKLIATLLAIVLLIGCGIGGTIAYLQAKSDPITNTFTASNLSITLTESKPTDQTAKMVPGADIEKDPKITVSPDSEDCYVFVKIGKSANFDTFMTFSPAADWKVVPNVNDVYYREVKNADTTRTFSVLADNKVTVKATVTKADMASISDNNKPSLSFTAYAIQSAYLKDNSSNPLTQEKIDEIWEMAKGNQAN